MKNEVLMTLNWELYQAKLLVESTENDLAALKKALGYAEYAFYLCEVGETLYGYYEAERDEANARFKDSLSKRDQALAELEIVCGEIKQYAINVCVPEGARETAVAEFNPSKGYVMLHFSIVEKSDEDEIIAIFIINGVHRNLSY